MKYDPKKKLTRPARRTLGAFSCAMFGLLTKKPLEEISVSEICEVAGYPRATFYNYFADKHDLACWCWHALEGEIHLEDREGLAEDQVPGIMFDRMYDYLQESRATLDAILANNPLGSPLATSFESHVRARVRELFLPCFAAHEGDVPAGLLADHYANTILLVLEWALLGDSGAPEKAPIGRQRAHEVVERLLGRI